MINPFRLSAATYSEFFISGYDYFHSDIYTAIELEFHDVKFDSSSETHLVEFQIHSHTDYRHKIYLELKLIFISGPLYFTSIDSVPLDLSLPDELTIHKLSLI